MFRPRLRETFNPLSQDPSICSCFFLVRLLIKVQHIQSTSVEEIPTAEHPPEQINMARHLFDHSRPASQES